MESWSVSLLRAGMSKAETARPDNKNWKIKNPPSPQTTLCHTHKNDSNFNGIGREWYVNLFSWNDPQEILLVSISLKVPEDGIAHPGGQRLWELSGLSEVKRGREEYYYSFSCLFLWELSINFCHLFLLLLLLKLTYSILFQVHILVISLYFYKIL